MFGGFFDCYFLFYLDREIFFFTDSLIRVSDKRPSTILLTLLFKPEFWTVDLYKRMTCEQLPKSKWGLRYNLGSDDANLPGSSREGGEVKKSRGNTLLMAGHQLTARWGEADWPKERGQLCPTVKCQRRHLIPPPSPVAPHPKPASGQRVSQRAVRPGQAATSASSSAHPQRPLPAAHLKPRPRSPPAPPRPGFHGPASRGSGLPRVPHPHPRPATLPPYLPPEAAGTARRQAGRFATLAPGVSHGARRRRSSEATAVAAAGPGPRSKEAAAAAAAGGAGRGKGEGAGAQAGASPGLGAGIPGRSAGGGRHHSA